MGAVAIQWSQLVYLGPYPVLLRPVIYEFFLGCLAALLVKRFAPRISGWWLIAPLALIAAVGRAQLVEAIDPYKWYAIRYFLLILTGASYDQAARRSYPRLAVLVGEASYSIYLIHYGLIMLFNAAVNYNAPDNSFRAIAALAPNLSLALLALAILGVGIVVHLGIEQPLLAAARRKIGSL